MESEVLDEFSYSVALIRFGCASSSGMIKRPMGVKIAVEAMPKEQATRAQTQASIEMVRAIHMKAQHYKIRLLNNSSTSKSSKLWTLWHMNIAHVIKSLLNFCI